MKCLKVGVKGNNKGITAIKEQVIKGKGLPQLLKQPFLILLNFVNLPPLHPSRL
jgi:hypothetical protein